jgi:mxaK protein
MTPSPHRPHLTGFLRTAGVHLWRAALAARTTALAVLIASGIAGIAASIWTLAGIERTNAAIRQLAAGKDIEADPAAAPPALIAARQHFLLTHDRINDAQIFTEAAAPRCDAAAQARLFYNLGNGRVRQAIALIEKGDTGQAVSIVLIAKDSLRRALRLAPGNWEAKYNLDVAQRLVRDLPRGEGEENDTPKDKEKPLWTDLPGQPRGLP